MSTKDSLDKLGDDPFDFIGKTARPVETTRSSEPDSEETELTKQISARLPLPLYRRWKLVLMEAKETQEALLVRMIEDEVRRRGG